MPIPSPTIQLFSIFTVCLLQLVAGLNWISNNVMLSSRKDMKTRISSGIWSRLYGWIVSTWLLLVCHPRSGSFPSSSQHMVKSLTLNPYMSLFNLKLCTYIWSTNINFRPPYWTFWSVLVWSFTLWVNWGGWGRLGLGHDFVTDGQKRDYLSHALQRARGATKN